MQEPEALGRKLHVHADDTGDVAARPTEACDHTGLDRVAAEAEDDWNRSGRGFGRERRGDATRRCDDSHRAARQIGRQFRQSIIVIVRPAVFDRDVAALGVAGFAQPFAERCYETRTGLWRARIKISDHRHRQLLLRIRRKRPHPRAAEKGDELAAFHLVTKALPMPGSIARPPWLKDTARKPINAPSCMKR